MLTIRSLASPILTRRTRPAATAPLAQQGNQLRFEFASRIGIDGVVDRLVRHMLAGILGVHAPQCAGNLLGRPTPQQQLAYNAPQRPMGMQLCQRPCRLTSRFARSLRRLGGVAGAAAVAPEFAADRAGTASEQPGYRALAESLLAQRREREAIFWLQVRVSR